jgi:hypothetical protein
VGKELFADEAWEPQAGAALFWAIALERERLGVALACDMESRAGKSSLSSSRRACTVGMVAEAGSMVATAEFESEFNAMA